MLVAADAAGFAAHFAAGIDGVARLTVAAAAAGVAHVAGAVRIWLLLLARFWNCNWNWNWDWTDRTDHRIDQRRG